MPDKKKRLLFILGLTSVFGILLGLATAFDLQVSHILADGNLTEGRYYSESVLCNLVEIAGAWPIWTAAVFAASVLTVSFRAGGGIKKLFSIFFFCLSTVSAALLLRDGLKYAFRIYEREELLEGPGTWLLSIAVGLVAAVAVLKLTGEWMGRNLERLLPFALAIVCCCCCSFLIELIKSPMGRMRYRGMHLLGDYSCYTPWYQKSAAAERLTGSGLVKDCFKSFPSGHTFSAGMSYILMMLPDVFPKFRTKPGKILCCVAPVCYTGFVGIFRIAAGAHFFSDVLVGGTLAYVAVLVFKYVFLGREKQSIKLSGGKAA